MDYFRSYSHVGVHEAMIKDSIRTETYNEAIMQHQSFIAGKVVMDVGCGTGILSIFCAQTGARRLYMAPVTQSDRYSERIDFWRSVYGIDMSAMLPLAKQCAFEEPSIETISGENVLSWPEVVKYVVCYTVSSGELEFVTKSYKFKSMMRAPLHGFAFWFDVEFYGPATAVHRLMPSHPDDNQVKDGSPRKERANPNEALVLSTSPEDPPTHWQQTVVYFYDPLEVEGFVTLTQSREHYRFMNIRLEYVTGGRSFVKESMMR